MRSSVIGVTGKLLWLWHEMWCDGRLRATEEVLCVHVDSRGRPGLPVPRRAAGPARGAAWWRRPSTRPGASARSDGRVLMGRTGHGHGHGCHADHHRGEYTERQRADLDLVLAFNDRLARAVDDNLDITDTVAALDPDPLRYMWVDEGDGQIPAQLAKAAAVLDLAPRLAGQTRAAVRALPDCRNAARPSVAAHGATTLVGWLEWEQDRGDRLVAELTVGASSRRTVVVEEPEDLFRPTAAVTADGTPWLLFGRSGRTPVRSGCGPAASSTARGARREPVSDTDGPSFNQEVVAHPDGSLHVCWQGRVGGPVRRVRPPLRRAARGRRRSWVTEGVTGNVWDPTLTATPDGMAYAWAEYAEGSYARRAAPRSATAASAGPVRVLTGGTDYALHPSLATTADGRLWCAFDVITVQGHGGSGPTRLRPRPHAGEPGRRAGRHARGRGQRAAGAAARGERGRSGWSCVEPTTGWSSRPASWPAG